MSGSIWKHKWKLLPTNKANAMRDISRRDFCRDCSSEYSPVFPAMGCPRCYRIKVHAGLLLVDAQQISSPMSSAVSRE